MKQIRSKINKQDIIDMNKKTAYYNHELSDIA